MTNEWRPRKGDKVVATVTTSMFAAGEVYTVTRGRIGKMTGIKVALEDGTGFDCLTSISGFRPEDKEPGPTDLEKLGYELSTYAASIHWRSDMANTEEWLEGLKEKIEAYQSAYAIKTEPHKGMCPKCGRVLQLNHVKPFCPACGVVEAKP